MLARVARTGLGAGRGLGLGRALSTSAPSSSSSSSSSGGSGSKAGTSGSGSPASPAPAQVIRLKEFPSSLLGRASPLAVLPLSLATANQKDITAHKISLSIKKFQSHATDSGSAAVQIAVATEKILNMVRHTALHRKDKHSNRGFQIMVARRKKMMKYLKRTNLEQFKLLVSALGLEREASHL